MGDLGQEPQAPRLGRALAPAVAVGALACLALSMWADPPRLADALGDFSWPCLAAALVLALANYLLRFAKWHYYLRTLAIRMRGRDSAAVFFSGLALSMSPGKLGELIKPYLVRRIQRTPVERTIPVVLAERVTDLVAVLLLALLGLRVLDLSSAVVVAASVPIVAVVALAWCRPLFEAMARRLARSRRLRGLAHRVLEGRESMARLLTPVPLAWATVVSLAAWFCECVGLYIVLRGFGLSVDLLTATSVYAFATLAGALSMLPGGLGVTEGSMTALLVRCAGVDTPVAAAATLIIRAATLWFAVALGAAVMLMLRRRLEAQGVDATPDATGRNA